MSRRAPKVKPPPAPRGRSSRFVIAADVVASIAVTLFATDMLRPGVPAVSWLILAAWAAVPRIAAEWIEAPRALFATRAGMVRARAFAILAVVLGLTVTKIALGAIPSMGTKSAFEMVLVVACWAAGFALRDAVAYKVYEPLCVVTLVTGVLRDCAWPVPLVTLAFLALAFSAALRRQIGHATTSRRIRKLRVRNAGAAAVLLAAAILAVFLLGRTALAPVLKPGPQNLAARLGPAGRRPEPDRGPGNPDKRTIFGTPGDLDGKPGAGATPARDVNVDSSDESGSGRSRVGQPEGPSLFDDTKLLVIVTAVLGAIGIFLLARSWKRNPPPKEPDEEEEEAAAALAETAPVVPVFVPRTPAEHLLADYGRLQEDLSESGQERRSWETPREHARRVAAPSDPATPAFGSLVPLVDDGLYGHAPLTDSDLATGRGAIGVIRKELG